MTTCAQISGWFDRGVAGGSTHMLVVCDTFSHEDYPVFCKSDAEAIAKHGSYSSGGNMQLIMEVYDLRADKQEQLAEYRAMRLPK